MIYVGIVGAEAAKFTPLGERAARVVIRGILQAAQTEAIGDDERVTLVSGGCHLGGVDIWAEEEADIISEMSLRIDKRIHLPKERCWSTGYKPRNLLIARDSAVVYNITVARYPIGFVGMRFGVCYHCERRFRETDHLTERHVKSGGCWIAYEAEKLGKLAQWYVIPNEEGQ